MLVAVVAESARRPDRRRGRKANAQRRKNQRLSLKRRGRCGRSGGNIESSLNISNILINYK